MGVQVGLLAVLEICVGLGPVGWAAGIGYAAVLSAVLTRALSRSGARSLGPANQVTLARAELVGGVTALVAAALAGRPVPVAFIVALAAAALVLDAVDGQVARRTGTVSALGARFDMEVDAFLILVLSFFMAGSAGPWVLAIGAMRYVFVAAAWAGPWLRAPLPPSLARKAVAVVQGVVLVVAAAGVLPRPVTIGLLGLALATLSWSFGRDTGWLWRHRPAGIEYRTPARLPAALPALPALRAGASPASLPAGDRSWAGGLLQGRQETAPAGMPGAA
ncbi:CDP-alcohol phosphatidyltransferase family protein [Actinomadura craniellae]|uniref:CDP-alcohol phosphatidyltransferase family protein n=1 Tax=Actinomadura craniellae TaxID=2231787 RepID=A0A365HEK2_9ACTN|nr:CDP-alcohol phosphatidyltransferase family protein [Actinomadura craniellae]